MAPAGRIERRDAHQAVHAALGGEQPVGVLAVDGEGDALDAGLVAFAGFVQLDVEAPALRPAQVHAQEHLGPVLALGAAGSRVDAHDGVAGVELPGEEALLLQTLQASRPISRCDAARALPPTRRGTSSPPVSSAAISSSSFQVVDLARRDARSPRAGSRSRLYWVLDALGVGLVVPEVGRAHRLLEEAMSRFSESGSKIVPCPQELLAENGQKLTVLGKGRGLCSLSSLPYAGEV